MDDADRATENDAIQTAAALAVRKPILYANGLCYNCGDRTDGVFCDSDCRADWERQKAAEQRNGF